VASRNRAIVEELIRSMNVRDRRPTHLFHPDIEWHWAAAIPGPTVFRGHEELANGLDTWVESWDELVVEPQEFLEDGDYVLALTQYRMRGAGSGVYLEAPVAHLHQFTEDGLVRRWWMFGNAEKAKRRFLAGDRPED
jgi:ketosteroid isomerase-like protein